MELTVQYLCSLDDSARVRATCLTYLQGWRYLFYPERPDLVSRLQQIASSLGGQLRQPRLSWKYSWIQKVFGWKAAKRAQLRYNRCKSALLRSCDKFLYRLGKQGLASEARL